MSITVGNLESTSVHRRSPKSEVQIPGPVPVDYESGCDLVNYNLKSQDKKPLTNKMGYCVWSDKCSCQVASQFRLSRTRTREYASAHLRLPTQLSCSNSGVMNHDIKQTSGSNLHPLFPRDERQSSKSMVRTPLMVRIHSYGIIIFFSPSYFKVGLFLILLGTLVSCGDDGSYKHDTSGDTALPYKHDTAGDKALPYKHDASGDKGLPYKHDTSGKKGHP